MWIRNLGQANRLLKSPVFWLEFRKLWGRADRRELAGTLALVRAAGILVIAAPRNGKDKPLNRTHPAGYQAFTEARKKGH